MEIVRELPLELARLVFGFGYPGQRVLQWKLLLEIKINFKSVTCPLAGGAMYDYMRQPEAEVRFLKQWADFCHCCERHRMNRSVRADAMTVLNPHKSNNCKCYCRRRSRLCLWALEMTPAEKKRFYED